ncbi:MAG: ATP-binding cassette domain-containing protein [Actinobacteria bacterium]|nr:ATP-binding cassette domain-containing protein [Actinomycetota bacterium]
MARTKTAVPLSERLSWLRSSTFLLKVLLVVILLVWPLVYQSGYATRIMITGGLYAIVTIAVVIILGQAGQLSFGHSAFYGIGAYTAALLAAKASLPTLAALVIGAVVAGLIALIVGRPVLKLRYFYLALATIGLGQIFLVLVTQLRTITGGATGLAPVPVLKLFGFAFNTNLRQYYLVWIVAFLVILFIDRALKYRVGRAFRAIATSEIASSSLGVRTANWKLLAFVTSAVICGLAGGLFAFVTMAVDPRGFTFVTAILPIVMMLLGGGTVWGSVIGAIVMTWVINGFSSVDQYRGVIYSAIMIVLLIFLPAGLALRPDQRARLKAFFRRERLQESAECLGAAEEDQQVGQCETSVGLPLAVSPGAGAQDQAVTIGAHDQVVGAPVERQGDLPAAVPGAPLLEVEDLSVHFGGLKAVDEVSLQVRAGEIVALIGPNGAGKTTLFNAVSRLQRLTGGSVRFAGEDVSRMSAANTARLGMARTFQNLRIYVNMSVLENVLVGCHYRERSGLWSGGLGLPRQRREEKASRERAMQALAMVGLEDSAHLPAASLPYGSQRLVEIARALASNPRLLLLDEPAAGMNDAERAYLVRQIRNINASGTTVLLVEHDIELVMGISERVYVLDYGELIAEGRPEEVQKNQAVIEAYLGVEHEQGSDLCQTRDLVSGECPEPEDMLVVEDLSTSYGTIQALRGVSLTVPQGQVVAVLGANGAGKSTLLHTISGLLRANSGSVVYKGIDVTKLAPDKIAARGVCQVPEGRRLFRDLSVEDNLIVGSSGRKDWRGTLKDDLAYVYELFPVLGERRKQPAGTLSGGEQQMLAIGRALVGRPKLLLLDEPSMGLAPLMVERIFESLAKLNKEGLTMLMVEQSAEMALALAHRAVILQNGSVIISGLAEALRSDERVRASYLGTSSAQTTLSGRQGAGEDS